MLFGKAEVRAIFKCKKINKKNGKIDETEKSLEEIIIIYKEM